MNHWLRLCLAGLSLVSLGSGYVYQCEPGTDPTVCSVWNFQYNGDEKPLPVLNMTSGVKKVRFVIELYYYGRNLDINRYDAVLHSTILRNPTAVQAIHNHITELHMPSDLQMGEFQHNSILTILTNRSETYKVTYLDLMQNMLRDISNLTVLVHLKTLNLEGNRISSLNSSTFAGMHNLSMLYLGGNSLYKLDFKVFPKGLTNLWLLRNSINKLDIAGASLPALRVLDLENNELTTIDLPALFAAFPALRVLPIAYNPMPKADVMLTVAELNRRNVSYHFGENEGGCDSGEFEVSNICFPGTVLVERSVWKAFMLLFLAVILVAIFVGSVRWIWYQMRY